MKTIRRRAAAFAALLVLTGLAALAGAGCDDPPPPSAEAPGATTAAAAAAPRIEIVKAPEGDVAGIVRRELEAAKASERALVVYVGAPWCEPCERFHKAAESRSLDRLLPPIRLLEFNLDTDAERLAAAGYQSKLIPLFAVPNEDGTASDRRVEGSVKGDGAVRNLVPRLRQILIDSR